jgi:peptidoglycan-associated lipoprotein
MKIRLASLLAATALLAACECGDSQEATTTGQCDAETVSGPTPGSEADFVTQVEDRVFFGFDKHDISPLYRQVLEKQAAWLTKYPSTSAEVAGYCDERGTVEYNDKLGQLRADVVRDELVKLGVDKSRLTTISYGKRVTLVPGSTNEAYKQNRTAITAIK